MEFKNHMTARGEVFGAEMEVRDIKQWRITVAQMRDAILQFGVQGATFPGGLAEQYAPSQREVETLSAMAQEAVRAGRVIDFGYVPNDVIMEGGRRGGPLYSQGAIGVPFRDPWMMLHGWEHGVAVYLINLLDLDKPAGGDIEAVELDAFEIQGHKVLAVGDRILLQPQPDDPKERYHCIAAPSAARFLPGAKETIYRGGKPENAAVGNVLDPVMTALMILSTSNVERSTVEPPARLNKARRASGKPPIPPYDVVDSGQWVTAMQLRGHPRSEDRGGTHASPVPHLRRGHFRQYASGERTFIRDTLVRVTPEARAEFLRSRQGSHYTVKR